MTTTSMGDRLAQLRARAAKARAPSLETTPEKFRIQRWFEIICVDRNRLQEALTYYQSAINDAVQHMTAAGHLETMLAETPGLEHFYKGVLVDAQQVRRWLDGVEEIESARKAKYLMYDPEARRIYGDLKVTEVAKLVKADDEIASLAFAIRKVANYENHLMSVIEGFTTRNINLGRIADIRKAGLQDVWVDLTKATENV